MYICRLIPRNFLELEEAFPIACRLVTAVVFLDLPHGAVGWSVV